MLLTIKNNKFTTEAMTTFLKIQVILILVTLSALTLKSCKKKPTPPEVTTSAVSDITQTTAAAGGNVISDGGAEVTARGVCWSTSDNPTIANSSKTSDGTGTGSFTSSLTQLTPGTTYYVRAYATNEAGTAYGNPLSFPTGEVLKATVTTAVITSHTQTSAVSGGSITSDGGGVITAKGVCWSNLTEQPTTDHSKTNDGTGSESFISNITGLTPNTSYYVRAYAINSAGVSYGNPRNFITSESVAEIVFNPDLTYGIVEDIEGNIYKTIQIGTQIWMAENLKTTKYNDYTSIPLVEDNDEWKNLTTHAFCWYDNDPGAYKAVYGALYNWYSVENGKLCPTGWHVPSYDEFTVLNNFLGEYSGYKLIETGTSHWQAPNTGATNETGFTWLPAGERYDIWGTYRRLHTWAQLWSTYRVSEVGYTYGYGASAYNAGFYVPNVTQGCSVRCLKD